MKRLAWLICAPLVLSLPALAHAEDGFTTANVNLRAGPDVDYPRITTVPAGTRMDIQGCTDGWEWCDVITLGMRGWVAGSYVQYDYQNQPVVVQDYGSRIGIPVISFVIGTYWNTYYRNRPFYQQRDYWYHRPIRHRPPPRPAHRPLPSRPPPIGNHPRPPRPDVGHPGNGHRPPARPSPSRPTPSQPRPGQGNRPAPGTGNHPGVRPPTDHGRPSFNRPSTTTPANHTRPAPHPTPSRPTPGNRPPMNQGRPATRQPPSKPSGQHGKPSSTPASARDDKHKRGHCPAEVGLDALKSFSASTATSHAPFERSDPPHAQNGCAC